MKFLQRLIARLFRGRFSGTGGLPPAFPPPASSAPPLPEGHGVAVRDGRVLCASPTGLHYMSYLEWGDPANLRVVICVHGLTRTGRDFDVLARELAKTHRVICPDVVGRGRSDWLRDKALYAVPQYVADMVTLIARLNVEKVDWVGTSMGGLIGMTLAAQEGSPIRRLVLNDVGPVISHKALNRIGTYVGKLIRFATFAEALAHIRHVHAPFGPHTDSEWEHIARHSLAADGDGFVFHYDPGIGDAFRVGPVLMDVNLWPLYDRITCPLLAVRGGDSDLLAAATLKEMSLRGPKAQTVEFPGVGHAPTFMHEDQISPVRDFFALP